MSETFQHPSIGPTNWLVKGLIYNARGSTLETMAEELVADGKAEWTDKKALVYGQGVIRDEET